ncbi:probable polyol transporter 4 [Tribolium madens]|uniref:probable polyol transporter 4 n=1 Tax=Tribolium madens TaxID=41895 RepID=UPI001CF74E0E|nr:probable polyol transporter 4 [Tribolium madens]
MSQVRPVVPRLLHFEDALQKTGWGLYYKFLVGFASANLFTNGFVFLCLHFALPLSACDTVLTKDDIISIYVCFNFGKAVGGFLLCSISDNTGKRCMISKSLIIIFGSCFISAFSHNMYTLYLAVFFLGSGLQANIASVKIYLAEILPVEKRGFYIILPDIFWTIGCFSTAVFLYYFGAFNSDITEHQGMDMRLTSWRIIFAIGGGLCITMGCTSALLEMSPRFLLFKRRIITATLILKQFYAINKSKYSETFDVQSQQLVDLISDYNINIDPEPVGMIQQMNVMVKVMLRMLRIMLRRPFIKVALVITITKLPTLFGLPGTIIYLAQIVDRKMETVTGGNFIHLNLIFHGNCSVSLVEREYENFLLISINMLFGQIMLLCIIDRFGRKFPIFAGLTLCSFTSAVLGYIDNVPMLAICSSFFTIGLTLVESTLFVVVVENFPTAVRGTALGVTYFYAHVTSCFLYTFLDMSRHNFHLLFAAFILGTSVLACFIPDMRKRPLVE